jgi:hypothetical protein
MDGSIVGSVTGYPPGKRFFQSKVGTIRNPIVPIPSEFLQCILKQHGDDFIYGALKRSLYARSGVDATTLKNEIKAPLPHVFGRGVLVFTVRPGYAGQFLIR